MSKYIVIVIILIVIAAAVWMIMEGKNSPFSPRNSATVNTPQILPVSLNTQNNSNELGMAVLTEKNGKVMVRIDLKGAPAGQSQPVTINLGSCPLPSETKYTLSPLVSGGSDTTLDVDMATLLKSMPLTILVHESDEKMKNYLVCGDFKL